MYEACRTEVEKFLYRKLLKVSEATTMDFYGLGYFYIRAVDLGFISTQLMLMLTPCYLVKKLKVLQQISELQLPGCIALINV